LRHHKQKQMTDRHIASIASCWLSLLFALYERENIWQTFNIMCANASICFNLGQLNLQKRCWKNMFWNLITVMKSNWVSRWIWRTFFKLYYYSSTQKFRRFDYFSSQIFSALRARYLFLLIYQYAMTATYEVIAARKLMNITKKEITISFNTCEYQWHAF